jgi:peroxiredoxin
MNDEINLFTILRNIFLLILTYILFSLSINNNKVNYKSKIKIHILIALFFFLVIQNVAFSIRNIELKKRIYKFIGEEILSKGEIVNPVKANTINGDLRYIDFTKYNKSLIFIMQFGCEPCRSNQKYWRQLYSHFGSEINIIGFCINNSELTKNLIKKDSLDYIVYSVPDEEFKINFKVYSTPQTILIDDKGIVKDIWKGRLNITILNQITNNLN